ncbi:MAG: class 1 fructose-bisphosphatase [Granulosicoccaceae bacterium]
MRSYKTLTQYLIEERSNYPKSSGAFNSAIIAIAVACKALSGKVSRGALTDVLGSSDSTNTHGETQKALDIIAHDTFVHCLQNGVNLRGIVSEENETLITFDDEEADYLLAVDPLDGSSNIDVNLSVGSIFSLLRRDEKATGKLTEQDFLQQGTEQVAAGYAIYGPATMLVLSVGNGTHAFTLDPEIGEFLLTQRNLQVPESCSEFAINASNSRFWEPPIKRYVEECLAGVEGPRERNFNMRWIASLVAEAHRIFQRGGVFMYPRDNKDPSKAGRLRLLYETNPIGYLIEQAGGRASTGESPMLEVTPTELHQRIGFVFGSREEVERIERYSQEPAEQGPETPLFNERGLFRNAD